MHFPSKSLTVFTLAAFAAANPAVAQAPVDDLRVRQLESEMYRLQRELEAQRQRIAALEQAARITPPAALVAPGPRPENTSPAWLVTANWDRIKTGMKTQEVIAILGRPTSTRIDDAGKLRLLFYAMELGPQAFLSGTVRMEDDAVAEVNRPVLR